MSIEKIIVTSGGTLEWIDPVRFISNASSGKMGYCIARELLRKKIPLTYIHGSTSDSYKNLEGAKNVSVQTTIQLRDAVLSELTPACLLIMAAAPADFRPIMMAEHKIKKEKGSATEKKGLLLELEENPDILQQVSEFIESQNWKNTIRVGFAAETQNLKEFAQEKLKRKGLHFIVGNLVGEGIGFGESDSQLTVYSKDRDSWVLGPASKENLAEQLVKLLESNIQFV